MKESFLLLGEVQEKNRKQKKFAVVKTRLALMQQSQQTTLREKKFPALSFG